MIDDYADYLAACGSTPATIQLRRYYLRRLTTDLGPDLLAIAPARLIVWLSRDTWAPETRKSARTSLAGFYRWAHLYGHTERDLSLLLPKVRVPRAVPRPVPAAIVTKALAEASDRDRLMLTLAAYAGLRRGEIARLRWADITEVPPLLTVSGKGGHQRIVPATPVVAKALAGEARLREVGGFGTGWRFPPDPTSEYVFPGLRGGHIHPDTVQVALSRALGNGWTSHTLRHRFASQSYAGSKDLRAVQELLGHASPQTTQRYVAVSSEALLAAAMAAAA